MCDVHDAMCPGDRLDHLLDRRARRLAAPVLAAFDGHDPEAVRRDVRSIVTLVRRGDAGGAAGFLEMMDADRVRALALGACVGLAGRRGVGTLTAWLLRRV